MKTIDVCEGVNVVMAAAEGAWGKLRARTEVYDFCC